MNGWTFDRILFVLSLVIIIISTFLLLTRPFSEVDNGSSSLEHKPVDPAALCSLPDHINPREWKMIFIHHSGDKGKSLEEIYANYLDAGEKVPYHFLIKPNGSIMVTLFWKMQQWSSHTGKEEYDSESIGICVIGDFSEKGGREPSEAQLESCSALVKHLMKTYDIPVLYVWAGGDVSSSREVNPGKHFPWDSFIRMVCE